MTFETVDLLGEKMAKEERDREDIFREATALVERVELSGIVGQAEPVVIGFRRNGCGSIYFGVELATILIPAMSCVGRMQPSNFSRPDMVIW